ncbi:MAG: sodium-dependent transporter [Enterocloster bolteae]|uniref:sodium-dependent transporter n=1 Tax=Enterocloster bolteae TaxID=208479 RepID=UPI003992671F
MINSTDTQRDSWKTNWGFILSCIGSAVGMGNIWMFPARVSKYGGGTFLLPYFLFVIMIGLSGVIGEMAFGRAARSGPIGAFGQAMASRGKGRRLGEAIGYIPVLGSLALAIGYSVIVGWILRYSAGSLTGTTLAPGDVDGFALVFSSMAGAFGNNFWQTVGLVITFIIMVLGISGGIEKINKIIMPLFFLLFLGLAVYMAFQPSAADGYRYIFRIDLKGLADPMTWVFALGQAFFSLSLAGNGTLIYGSYLDDREDVTNAAWKVALFDTLAALLAALVIIPAMATAGSGLDEGGPGLIFIYLPNLFKSMPGSRILVIVFYTAVLLAGISSLINLLETPIAAFQQQFKLSRRTSVSVISAAALAIGLCIQGIVSGWMDFVSIYICPLGAGLAGIMFFWVFGSDYAKKEVEKGRLRPIGPWFSFMTSYLFCGLTAAVFVLGIVFGGIG